MSGLKGRLLIAKPRLVDPNFHRTVLLMLEHSDTGALGVILNRPTPATVSELSEQILEEPTDWEKTIHLGGPVAGPMMVLHTVSELADQTVRDGLYTTIDATKINELIRARVEPSRLLANYSGWGPGQLESEIEHDSWYTCDADPDEIFDPDHDAGLWDRLVKRIHHATLENVTGFEHWPDDPRSN
jgi:putative transcriptional regulator